MIYFIGEFARISGFSIDTLRYYGKVGFLRPQRNTSNRRVYTDQDLKWVKFIKLLKQTGMPIQQDLDFLHHKMAFYQDKIADQNDDY